MPQGNIFCIKLRAITHTANHTAKLRSQKIENHGQYKPTGFTQNIMSRTWTLLELRFGVIASIIFGYFLPRKINDKYIAKDGYYEAHDRIVKKEVGLMAASAGGHLEMVKLMISRGATNFGGALRYAWENDHIEVAKYLMTHKIELWDHPLRAACRLGNRNLIDLCISNGIMDWTPAVYGACRRGDLSLFLEMYNSVPVGDEIDPVLVRSVVKGGNLAILSFLIHGASRSFVRFAMQIACGYANTRMIKFLTETHYDITFDWNAGLWQACSIGNIHGICLAIRNGATDLEPCLGTAIRKNRTYAAWTLIGHGAKIDDSSYVGADIYDMEFASVMLPPWGLEKFLKDAIHANRPEIAHIIAKQIRMRDCRRND